MLERLEKYRLLARRLIGWQLVKPAQSFFRKEASSSFLLLLAAFVALTWANSPSAAIYHDLWKTKLIIGLGGYQISKSLFHWINDGLMTFFFFIVGLEIKREILVGELASLRKALLPAVAALGGMLVPGIIYLIFNYGTPTAGGWGVPMATDIAFALGAVAAFGRRLPISVRIFLSAFAIADDLGAVFIIALFYTQEIVWHYLIICIISVVALGIANFLWVNWTPLYGLLGLGIWFAVLGSGIHPTVAGIVVAMFIPARGRYNTDYFVKRAEEIMDAFQCEAESCGYSILLNRNHLDAVRELEEACHDVETPLQQLEHTLHPLVAYAVIPLFALANAGLTLEGMDLQEAALHPVTLGTTLGLFIGKPLGIFLFSYLAVKTGLASLPKGMRWSHLMGAGLLGGIGFTMSLFISDLSFASPQLLAYAKMGILLASVLAATVGMAYLLTDYLRHGYQRNQLSQGSAAALHERGSGYS